MRTRQKQKEYSIKRAAEQVAATDEALRAYTAGEISVNELFRRASFERVGYWFDCSHVYTRHHNGREECSKLVRILSNWEFITNGSYFDYSFVNTYRHVYYTADGERIVLELDGTSYGAAFRWEKLPIDRMFHLPFISAIRANGSKYLNRRMDRIMRLLAGRYPGLDLTQLTD